MRPRGKSPRRAEGPWFRGGDWANQWLSLRHVFGILVQLGDHRAAATLHGALTATGAAYALPFEASDAARIDKLVVQLRDEMGAADFAVAVRRGASMTDGEILEFVQERIRAGDPVSGLRNGVGASPARPGPLPDGPPRKG